MNRLVIITALILFAIPLSAQQKERIANTFGFGGSVGWYSSNDAEEGAMYFNAIVRARLGSNFAFEGMVGYRSAEDFNASNYENYQIGADVSYIPITVSAMFLFPLGDVISPYAIAGVGWYYTIKDYDLIDIQDRGIIEHFTDGNEGVPGYHIGLGIELPFSSSAALHAEWRYLFLGTEIRSLNDARNASYSTKDSDGMMFSLGLMLYM